MEERRAAVPVPAGYERQIVEFVDAEHGYAQFLRCGPDPSAGPAQPGAECAAVVVRTTDGGRSWQRLNHPRRVAANHQMYTGDADTVLLLAEPHGWYLSTDAGRTFRHRPANSRGTPPEYFGVIFGRYWQDYERENAWRIVEKTGSGSAPLPAQPTLPGRPGAFEAGADGRLWAASVGDGRVYTSVSADQGRTWQRRDVPAPARGRPDRVRLVISADGRDAWLLGYSESTGGTGGGGRSAVPRMLRKDVGLPEIWRFDGVGWTAVPTAGLPSPGPAAVYSFAAVGDGWLAVADGQGTSGYLSGTGYGGSGGGPRLTYVRALRDGTLFGYGDHQARRIWLGPGAGTERHWVEVMTAQG